MRKAKTIMSLALTAAMVTSMTAPTPVMAAEGFDLNLCIASEPQTIDPALNSAVDGAIMCNICSKVWLNG